MMIRAAHHWCVIYEPATGAEIADVCTCHIGHDHNGDGDLLDEVGGSDD